MKTKDSLVKQLLCRWWYALPDYPPEDYNYASKLEERALREVDLANWKLEPETKEEKTKCFQMKGFKGVFRDCKGNIHDLRPSENRPSYNNFMKKDEKELYSLLLKAFSGQLDCLNESPKYSTEVPRVIKEIQSERDRIQALFNRKYN